MLKQPQFSRRRLIQFAGALVWIEGAAAQKKPMPPDEKARWLREAADEKADLIARMRVLAQLAASGDKSVISELKRMLARPRPAAEPELENWDPPGAERVVDLHIIRTLHALGDYSEGLRAVDLLREAGSVLQGPYEEVLNAIETIRALGRVDVIQGVVGLAGSANPSIAANAVRTLDALSLPEPPVGQDLGRVSWAQRPLSFKISFLKQELETIVSLSEGRVILSPGVSDFAERHNYDRGEVARQDQPLGEVIENDMRLLGFDYYLKGDRAVVCTMAEAAKRWVEWWQAHGARLVYSRDRGRFLLRN